MKPVVPARIVPPAKIRDYLLRSDHPVGGAKAAFFHAFGFTLDRPEVMANALLVHPDHNPVSDTESSRWGLKYTVRCHIRSPDGRDPCIVTVWIVPPTETEARLVTAYPNDGG